MVLGIEGVGAEGEEADLARCAICTADDAPVGDDAHSDSRPDRDEDEVSVPTPDAAMCFSERGSVDIVVEEHRMRQQLHQTGSERLRPDCGQIRRKGEVRPRRVGDARAADPGRPDLARWHAYRVGEVSNRLRDLREQVGVLVRCP